MGGGSTNDIPPWARRLNLSPKWAVDAQGLEINGESFLVADLYALDRSTTIALVGDATEHDIRFLVLPHPRSREKVQVLVWKEE